MITTTISSRIVKFMRNRSKPAQLAACAAVFALVALGGPPQAVAQGAKTNVITTSNGFQVYANWEFVDPTGCIFVGVAVVANSYRDSDTSAPLGQKHILLNDVFLGISVFDFCTGIGLLQAEQDATNGTLVISGDLSTATVHAHEALADQNTNPFDSDVALSFTATNALQNSIFHNVDKSLPGMMFITHLVGSARDATVTGSISVVGNVNYPDTPNLLALPNYVLLDFQAQITKLQSGVATIVLQ